MPAIRAREVARRSRQPCAQTPAQSNREGRMAMRPESRPMEWSQNIGAQSAVTRLWCACSTTAVPCLDGHRQQKTAVRTLSHRAAEYLKWKYGFSRAGGRKGLRVPVRLFRDGALHLKADSQGPQSARTCASSHPPPPPLNTHTHIPTSTRHTRATQTQTQTQAH